MTSKLTPTIMTPRLTLAGAQAAAEGALAHASHIGMTSITVSVVDEGGHLLVLTRNKAPHPTIDISRAKAQTSASFGVSSAVFGQHTQADNPMTRADLTTFGGMTGLAGGEPIMANNQLIGGIGVSGGSEEQDAACAKAGAKSVDDASAEIDRIE